MRLVVSVLSLWLAFVSTGCGRRAPEHGAGDKQVGTEGGSAGKQVSSKGPRAPVRNVRPVSPGARPTAVSADSATGLAICDRYLKTVCGCAARDPVLRKACDEGTKSAPRWKQTSGQDPEQRRVVSESCRQALKMIEESFGCKQ